MFIDYPAPGHTTRVIVPASRAHIFEKNALAHGILYQNKGSWDTPPGSTRTVRYGEFGPNYLNSYFKKL